MPRMSFTEISRPHHGVAVVMLNRPERMNAMAFDVMIPFRDALREIGSDNGVRVVVITGAGRGFCSGADHENPGTMPHMEGLTLPTIALRSMELLDDVISTIRRLHQPVIAAVNGAAIGGGFCLALAADIRIAADDAYFRAAGINNGLTAAELGLSYLLPRSVGHSRAAEIMLTGRDIDAEEADRIGLVSRVVPRRPNCCRPASSWPIASTAGAGPESRSPSASSGTASTPAACSPTWTPRARPSSSSASQPAISRSPWPLERKAGRPTSRTEQRRSGSVDERLGRHLEVIAQLERIGR